MGVKGLLKLLADITHEVPLAQFKGCTVAVDGYIWLHRGVYPCAADLAQGKPVKSYVHYCMRMVFSLKSLGIVPIVVLDGANLPSKKGTDSERALNRSLNLEKAKDLLTKGKLFEADKLFAKCVDITHEMAYEFIKELRKHNIQFVVAPYEADAQLTYLVNSGIAQAAISEDSDIFVFGCKQVIYKHNEKTQKGSLIKQSDRDKISIFKNYNLNSFQEMCIFSGCDYLQNPPGIGLGKARKLLQLKTAEEIITRWEKGSDPKAPKLPEGYAKKYRLALLTFKFQRVYDPLSKKLTTLHKLPEFIGLDEEVDNIIGKDIDPIIARGIAEGFLNPTTKLPWDLNVPNYLSEYVSNIENININNNNNNKETSLLIKQQLAMKKFIQINKSIKVIETIDKSIIKEISEENSIKPLIYINSSTKINEWRKWLLDNDSNKLLTKSLEINTNYNDSKEINLLESSQDMNNSSFNDSSSNSIIKLTNKSENDILNSAKLITTSTKSSFFSKSTEISNLNEMKEKITSEKLNSLSIKNCKEIITSKNDKIIENKFNSFISSFKYVEEKFNQTELDLLGESLESNDSILSDLGDSKNIDSNNNMGFNNNNPILNTSTKNMTYQNNNLNSESNDSSKSNSFFDLTESQSNDKKTHILKDVINIDKNKNKNNNNNNNSNNNNIKIFDPTKFIYKPQHQNLNMNSNDPYIITGNSSDIEEDISFNEGKKRRKVFLSDKFKNSKGSYKEDDNNLPSSYPLMEKSRTKSHAISTGDSAPVEICISSDSE